ncbi:MAG: hypothetical protein AUH25_02025 [Thaumarchaeota archaeon 13_1_40CM_38_12]|nr:MAG: hypothetical protein AUH25_02025 [Thaumarchaeota archaeon 13_1_40CM_38_12]OLD40999.1 MAG: hypothetical protein AUI60_03020 [Thaumarchaeota archaeon 13_1_40CM_2_39_4]
MSLLTDFESDLLRLVFVEYRALAIFNEFPNQMIKDHHHLLVRSVFREMATAQLHNFIIIHKDLLRYPEFKKLDDVIHSLVKPILDLEEPIKLLRHNYVSHVQEGGRKFELTIQEICEKYKLPSAWGYWRYLCGLVFFYIEIIHANFFQEYNKAHEKYNAMSGEQLVIPSDIKMNNSLEKIAEIFIPIITELDKHGYKVSLSAENMKLLEKTTNVKYGSISPEYNTGQDSELQS